MLEIRAYWCGLTGSWAALSEGVDLCPSRLSNALPRRPFVCLSLRSNIIEENETAGRVHQPAGGRSQPWKDLDSSGAHCGGSSYEQGLPNPQEAKAEKNY